MGIVQDEMQEQPDQLPVAQEQPAEQPAGQSGQDPRAMLVFRRLTVAVMKTVYEEKMFKSIVEMMTIAKDSPAQALAQTATAVLSHMRGSVKGTDPKIVFAATSAVIFILAEIAEKSGIFKADTETIKAAIAAVEQHAALGEQAEQPQQAPGEMQPQMPPQMPGGPGGMIQQQMGA